MNYYLVKYKIQTLSCLCICSFFPSPSFSFLVEIIVLACFYLDHETLKILYARTMFYGLKF